MSLDLSGNAQALSAVRSGVQVAAVPIMGKMAGAVGNYNAHISAYPEVCTRVTRWPDHHLSCTGLAISLSMLATFP